MLLDVANVNVEGIACRANVARRRHDDVEVGISAERVLDEAVDRGFIGDISLDERRVTAGGPDEVVRRLAALAGARADVADNDARTFLREAQRTRAADPRTSPGHDRHLAVKPFHGWFRLRWLGRRSLLAQ